MIDVDSAGGHRVVVLGYAGALGVELLAVRDLFDLASDLQVDASGAPAYRVEVASVDGSPIDLGRGLTLTGVLALGADTEPVDTFVVVGGLAAPDVAARDPDLVAVVAATARRSARVVSVCTGAFLLAAAGLLDGRRATTHWGAARRLAEDHPTVSVEPDAIYLRDGEVWTSAGVSAAIDLVLALVEEDLGADRAVEVARLAVVFLRRSGGQSQFSVHLDLPQARRRPVRDVQRHVLAHPGADLSLAALADQVNLSPRHLARLFRAEVGVSLGHYVDRVRLEAARRAVETSDRPLATVAAETGLGTAENLRRVFVATLGVAPTDYRRRFGPLTS